MVTSEVRAAVGGLVIETTWLEFLAARLVAIAGDTKDEMALLRPQQKVFKRARKSAAAMQDPNIQQRTVDWLKRAEELQSERHKVVHSIVLYDGRRGWHGYHPRSGDLRRMEKREIVELAEQARQHADEGNYRSLYEWRLALGVELGRLSPTSEIRVGVIS
jgi:hypothetical protein